jgi:D-3-phosphoglycerate dehydrogenase
MAVSQIKDYLEHGNIRNSVNFPQTSMPRNGSNFRLTFTNKNISGVLGHFLSIFADNNINVVDMVNKSRDEVAYNILDLDSKPSDEVLSILKNVEHVFHLRHL